MLISYILCVFTETWEKQKQENEEKSKKINLFNKQMPKESFPLEETKQHRNGNSLHSGVLSVWKINENTEDTEVTRLIDRPTDWRMDWRAVTVTESKSNQNQKKGKVFLSS